AEDGIRDDLVTGVQTCALPISFGMTLGGGCEVVMHAARAQASAELYLGMVETGVGVIPAGGGCKEMLLRTDPKDAFELIAYAKEIGRASCRERVAVEGGVGCCE